MLLLLTSIFISLSSQDRYAFNRIIPRYDASQDWELTGANEEGEFTTLQFERKLETCDTDDISINFVSYSYQHWITNNSNECTN